MLKGPLLKHKNPWALLAWSQLSSLATFLPFWAKQWDDAAMSTYYPEWCGSCSTFQMAIRLKVARTVTSGRHSVFEPVDGYFTGIWHHLSILRSLRSLKLLFDIDDQNITVNRLSKDAIFSNFSPSLTHSSGNLLVSFMLQLTDGEALKAMWHGKALKCLHQSGPKNCMVGPSINNMSGKTSCGRQRQ